MIRPDFRDYQGHGMELIHSAKGTTWTNHKYIRKEGKRYIYKEESDSKRESRKNGEGATENKKSPQEILNDLKKSGKYTAEELARFGKMTAEELSRIGSSVSAGAKKAASAAKKGAYKVVDEVTAERTSGVRPTHPGTKVKKRGASPTAGSKVSSSRTVSRGTDRNYKSSNMTPRSGGTPVTSRGASPSNASRSVVRPASTVQTSKDRTISSTARKKKKKKRTLQY